MKKSKFYREISKFVKEWEGSDLSYKNQFAKALLVKLEELGMKPPAQESYEVTDMAGNVVGKLDDVYEWEKE